MHANGSRLALLGRLLPNGAFDPAFNGGSVWVWPTLRGGEVRTLIQRGDGQVYVGATCDIGTSSAVESHVFRRHIGNGCPDFDVYRYCAEQHRRNAGRDGARIRWRTGR